MSMDYIRRTYGVPAKRGMRVTYTPDLDLWPSYEGVIVGSRVGYLRVRVVRPLNWRGAILTIHPTWRVGYDVPSTHTKKEA